MRILVVMVVIFNLHRIVAEFGGEILKKIQFLTHLELNDVELRGGQVELDSLCPAGAEAVVPDCLGGVLLVVPAVVLVTEDLHNNVGIDDLALLAAIRPGNVLTREDLHGELEPGELCLVQLSSIVGAVLEARFPSSQSTVT